MLGSVFVHGAVVAVLMFGWYWLNARRETLGEAKPAGGPAYSVSPVHNIPIPQQEAPPTPVANDTQSNVPSAPAKQEEEKQRHGSRAYHGRLQARAQYCE